MKKINILTLVTLLFASLGFAQELVTNGDFETGDATGWSGNAANVVTENGNSYNAANVETAGNPYDVNLSSGLSLTPGATYTLTFDAWSDTDRTLIAGIGLYEAPWSNTSETVTLSTTSQTYTLTLTATGDVNSNSRVLFDMGAATGFVGIDNVSLIEDNDTTPTEGPTTHAPTPPARPEADVVSIYSDAYTSTIAFDNFDAGWCGGAAVTPVVIDGDNTLEKNAGIDCHGINFESDKRDLSEFTHLHFDFYITDEDLTGDVFNVKLVDFAGGTAEASALEVNINGGTTPTLVANTWVSVDVDITELVSPVAGNLTRSDVAQIGITTANVTNVWYDNIYLHKNTTLGVNDLAKAKEVKLYPNPVKAGQDVMFSGDVTSVEVYSTTGKQVKVLKGASFNTSGLAKGVYFVRIKTAEGQIQTQKLLVK